VRTVLNGRFESLRHALLNLLHLLLHTLLERLEALGQAIAELSSPVFDGLLGRLGFLLDLLHWYGRDSCEPIFQHRPNHLLRALEEEVQHEVEYALPLILNGRDECLDQRLDCCPYLVQRPAHIPLDERMESALTMLLKLRPHALRAELLKGILEQLVECASRVFSQLSASGLTWDQLKAGVEQGLEHLLCRVADACAHGVAPILEPRLDPRCAEVLEKFRDRTDSFLGHRPVW
jgi:hypothetical protein